MEEQLTNNLWSILLLLYAIFNNGAILHCSSSTAEICYDLNVVSRNLAGCLFHELGQNSRNFYIAANLLLNLIIITNLLG
jgi:hypothetical protein